MKALYDPTAIKKIIITGITRDEKLGIITLADNMPPYKGRYPDQQFILHTLNGAKSVFSYTLYLIQKTPLGIFCVIPFIRDRVVIRMIDAFQKNFWVLWQRMENDYCRSGQEILRAVKVQPWYSDNDTFIYGLKTFLCFWEFDDAYRFRGQDMLGELKKENLNNPRKELKRLLDIAIRREGYVDLKDKYRRLKLLLDLVPRKYLKKVGHVLEELNLDLIRLDEDDLEWAKPKNYNYGDRDYHSIYLENLKKIEYNKDMPDPIDPRALSPEELETFNKSLSELCKKFNVKLDIVSDPKLQVTKVIEKKDEPKN